MESTNFGRDIRPQLSPKHLDRSKSVFINCPFDKDFEQLFDAIVFATVCCGFLPRSALETGNVADPRMDRIMDAMFSSKYSIHDLSRCKGEGDFYLARFNMPLELGIAMTLRSVNKLLAVGQNPICEHDWLVLVPESHQYIEFISDLAGYDLKKHDGKVENVIKKVMSWLVTRNRDSQGLFPYPKPNKVLTAFPAFRNERLRLSAEWGEDIPWIELVNAAHNNAPIP